MTGGNERRKATQKVKNSFLHCTAKASKKLFPLKISSICICSSKAKPHHIHITSKQQKNNEKTIPLLFIPSFRFVPFVSFFHQLTNYQLPFTNYQLLSLLDERRSRYDNQQQRWRSIHCCIL